MTHEADAKTVSLVERAILESRDYETEEQLFAHLSGKMEFNTFKSAIAQLFQAGKIMYNEPSIIYTGTDNPKLRALVESSAPV